MAKRLVGKAKIGCRKASYEMMEAWLGVEVVTIEVMRSQPLTFIFRSKMLVLQFLHPQNLIKKFFVVQRALDQKPGPSLDSTRLVDR